MYFSYLIGGQSVTCFSTSIGDRLNRSDIQRKVVSARIVSTPAFRSAYQKAAHACPVRMGSTPDEGEYKRSALGEYSQRRTLEWKLRMYTFFHHVFKRSICSELNTHIV